MAYSGANKWFARAAGGMTGVAGPGDDVLQFTRWGKQVLATRPNLAWGVRNLAGPVSMIGKVELIDKVVLGGASARTLEVITFGRYQAPQSAWDNSPKARFERVWKHGVHTKPSDRMRSNPPMISSSEVARRDFQRYT